MIDRIKRFFFYAGFLASVLVGIDLLLIALDLFRPVHNYGDERVGFLVPAGRGVPYTYQTTHSRFADSDTGAITVNQRGFRTDRTIREIQEKPKDLTICVLGDSQTELPYRLEYTHAHALQEELRSSGLDVEVLAAGRGGFSPLQAVLYFDTLVSDLKPSVIILNLYTGNDLFDMIRMDDRPYYEADGRGGYGIHPPMWYKYTNPADSGSVLQKSRVLFLAGTLARNFGLQGMVSRVWYLTSLAREHGEGIGFTFSYIRDLAETRESSLDYPPAFAAQVLNQHLFFSYFPKARVESLHRMRFLLASMRKESADCHLVLSLIPSPVLCPDLQTEPILLSVLSRLDVTMHTVAAEERTLYDSCLAIAQEEGWHIIDNRETMDHDCRKYWMMEDLHLSPEGSVVIGQNQAEQILPMVRAPHIP